MVSGEGFSGFQDVIACEHSAAAKSDGCEDFSFFKMGESELEFMLHTYTLQQGNMWLTQDLQGVPKCLVRSIMY